MIYKVYLCNRERVGSTCENMTHEANSMTEYTHDYPVLRERARLK